MSGAQTIRDVLIRVGLQANSSGFSAPDLKKVEREANDAAAAVGKLNKELRGGGAGGIGGSPRAPGGASSQRAPDLFAGIDIGVNKYKDAVTRQKQFVDQIVAADEKMLSRGESMQRYYQDAAKATDQFSKSQKAAMEISNQRAEATMLLANAGMKLARGVAFVTAANEQEYQSMLKLIATAQGYFDIFSGTIDAYKSYLNFSKAATAAKIAEAGATNMLAASETRASVARLGGVGRGALGMAGRVSGPLAIAAGVGLAGRFLIRDAYGLGTRERYDRQRQERTDAYNSPEAAAARDAAGTARMQQFDSMISGRVEAGRGIRSVLGNNPRGFDLRTLVEGVERDRSISTQMIQSADFKGSPQQWAIENETRRNKVAEINLQAEQEKQAVYQKQQEILQRQLDTSLSLKQAAVETLRAEENRYRSAEESIGRLSRSEAQRLKGIGEKLKSGKDVSRSEIEFAESRGGGIFESQIGSYYAKRGRSQGSAEILAGTDIARGISSAQANLQDFANGEAARSGRQVADELDKLNKTLDKSFTMQIEMIRKSVAAAERLASEQAKLEQQLNQVQNGQQNSNAIWNFGLF